MSSEKCVLKMSSRRRLLAPIFVDCDTALQPLFRELAVSQVAEEQASCRVGGDIHVAPAVVVEVNGGRCHSVGALRGSHAARRAHIDELAAVVSEPPVPARRQTARSARDGHAFHVQFGFAPGFGVLVGSKSM